MAVTEHFRPDGSIKDSEALEREFGEDFSAFQRYFVQTRLDDIILSFAIPDDQADEELAHRRVFLDLLKRMLELDPETRVSAADAQDHAFLQLLLTGRAAPTGS
jgi:serine/threonine protein kinase